MFAYYARLAVRSFRRNKILTALISPVTWRSACRRS